MAQSPVPPEPICLDNSIEEDLLNSFANLPHSEQQAITSRLGELRMKLLRTQDTCQINMQCCPTPSTESVLTPNFVQQGSKSLIPVSAMSVSTTKTDADGSTLYQLRTREPEDSHLLPATGKGFEQGRGSRNGCIVLDHGCELDKITEDD